MGFLFRVSSCIVPTAEIREKSRRMVPRAFTVHCTVLVSSPVLGIKHSDQSHLREKRFVMAHGLRVQSITVGKPGQWDLETAGRITSTGLGRQTQESPGVYCLTGSSRPVRDRRWTLFLKMIP